MMMTVMMTVMTMMMMMMMKVVVVVVIMSDQLIIRIQMEKFKIVHKKERLNENNFEEHI